jgi:hypothetical protein
MWCKANFFSNSKIISGLRQVTCVPIKTNPLLSLSFKCTDFIHLLNNPKRQVPVLYLFYRRGNQELVRQVHCLKYEMREAKYKYSLNFAYISNFIFLPILPDVLRENCFLLTHTKLLQLSIHGQLSGILFSTVF